MRKTFNDYRAALIGVGPATRERILAEAEYLRKKYGEEAVQVIPEK